MREIKFRAWDKQKNEWLLITGFETKETKISDGYTLDALFHDGDFVGREDVALMQYTGFKDKNGKEIYEGDIVQTSKGSIGVIAWHQKWASFCVKLSLLKKEDGRFSKVWGSSPLYNEAPNYVKIGNHFNNPELLEV